MATQIYLIEDHPLMRQVLCEAIEELSSLSVCGMAASAEEALDALNDIEADVALIDLSLPKMSGVELVGILQKRYPALRCLILSGHKEASYVEQAFAAGAQGYLLKGDPSELKEAIEVVLAGNRYLGRPLRTS